MVFTCGFATRLMTRDIVDPDSVVDRSIRFGPVAVAACHSGGCTRLPLLGVDVENLPGLFPLVVTFVLLADGRPTGHRFATMLRMLQISRDRNIAPWGLFQFFIAPCGNDAHPLVIGCHLIDLDADQRVENRMP